MTAQDEKGGCRRSRHGNVTCKARGLTDSLADGRKGVLEAASSRVS